jgi:hypothetical protein
MPLPDADPPNESRLYEELKSKTALPSATGAITPDLLDNLKNATFLDAENEDQLRRLVLLMQATGVGSMSGPIPGTQKIQHHDITATNYTTILTPGVGEVWQFTGLSSRGTVGISGTIVYELDIYNATDDTRLLIIDASTSSSADFPITEQNFTPVNIAYPQVCRVRVEGTFTEARLASGFIRVR